MNLEKKLSILRKLYENGGEDRAKALRQLRKIGWSLIIQRSTGIISGAHNRRSKYNSKPWDGYRYIP